MPFSSTTDSHSAFVISKNC